MNICTGTCKENVNQVTVQVHQPIHAVPSNISPAFSSHIHSERKNKTVCVCSTVCVYLGVSVCACMCVRARQTSLCCIDYWRGNVLLNRGIRAPRYYGWSVWITSLPLIFLLSQTLLFHSPYLRIISFASRRLALFHAVWISLFAICRHLVTTFSISSLPL